MTVDKIILGSSSVWRKKVLSDHIGIKDFTVMSPDIDEKAIRDTDARKLTMMITQAKTDALLDKVLEPSILICSDQVIVCNNKIREKPVSEEECREYLKSYEKYPAECIVSVVVVNTKTGKRLAQTEVAVVHFKPLPDELIEKLIEIGDVMYCAGGFTIEHMTEYVERIDGEMETVMGLPKTMTIDMIRQAQQENRYSYGYRRFGHQENSIIVAKIIAVYDNPPRIYYKSEKKARENHQKQVQEAYNKRAAIARGELSCTPAETQDSSSYSRWGERDLEEDDIASIYERDKIVFEKNRRSSSKRYSVAVEQDHGAPTIHRDYEEIFSRDEQYEVRIITEDEYKQLSQQRADLKLLNQFRKQEIIDNELKKEQKSNKSKNNNNNNKPCGFTINDNIVKQQLLSYLKNNKVIQNNGNGNGNGSGYGNGNGYGNSIKNSNSNEDGDDVNYYSDEEVDDNDNSSSSTSSLAFERVYLSRGAQRDFLDDDDDDDASFGDTDSDVYSNILYGGNATPDFYYQGYAVDYENALNDDGVIKDDIDYDEEEFSYSLTTKELEDWEKLKVQYNFSSNEQLQEEYVKLSNLFESNYIPKYEFIIRRNTLCSQYSNNKTINIL
ncbi:maf family protein [Heterostelium album PN500]|uniref:Maf family protein n=1 Tax=Heterostelium pallidum (strain ATCC 26659 / Pp 5 / PN500) TaxID=670386 RepID=D3BGQ7_HETP5|nr:maf family protein [Heterostelium album PN500]EFA79291.1 maf family protein [Heterostelium album PN500]|eukprot:XP_020431412.1 maf family protein [Heterostelium album PN500]